MKIREVMTAQVETIGANDSVQLAARKMRELGIGALPVHDHDRLIGMLTDRDIAVRLVAEAGDARMTRVREVMTPEVVYCFEDQEVGEAIALMRKNVVRRIVVLDSHLDLVGIFSTDDLAPREEELTAPVQPPAE